jgi:hypothetical protein
VLDQPTVDKIVVRLPREVNAAATSRRLSPLGGRS